MAEFHFSPRPNRASEIGWREWSPGAFEEAGAADRPILLSISAVWCHWCHVMDETTYSTQPVIDLIRERFLPIRVDNDVRPDINQRYNMGGWPTTAFLTPGGEILTGATYLPADQMLSALEQVSHLYGTRKREIVGRVREGKRRAGDAVAASAGGLAPALVEDVLAAVERSYDPVHGGFGSAPKFPQTDALLLLAEQSVRRGRPELMGMARHTLARMAAGGSYDHVEGGFFRYSTMADWSVPHFEKMLEDHAGLVSALAMAGMPEVLDGTTAYLERTLRDPATGLYGGSQDADEHYYALDEGGRRGVRAPQVDRRVYSSWNCAIAVAYLEADRLLDRPRLGEGARATLERLFADRHRPGTGLMHSGEVGGLLQDQAWGLLACLRAHSAGLGPDWLGRARELAGGLDARYGDARFGGYFDRAAGGELGRLGERVKPLAENAILALALHELDVLEGDPDAPWHAAAERALASVASLPGRYGLMAASFARALDRILAPAVKVTTANRELARTALLADPHAVIEPGDQRAVVCVGTECLAPADTPDQLRRSLERMSARV
ncbi:MAG: thioredoxin domain-containing protein [Candidatus Dormibacteraceae bacterium]